jgi:hypothetical protein
MVSGMSYRLCAFTAATPKDSGTLVFLTHSNRGVLALD